MITGDYLAELTMLILGRDQLKDPSLGYARTFVRQLEDCLGLTPSNAASASSATPVGSTPRAWPPRLREVARGLGLDPVVAHVEGDNLAPRAAELGFEGALTANAYLGAFGIAEALGRGADVVVTGRVTDASVVVGPAIAEHGWSPDVVRRAGGRRGRRPRDRVRHPGHGRQLLRLPLAAPRRAGRSASRSPRSPPTARP